MTTKEQPGSAVELADVSEHPFLRGLNQEHLQALADCAMRLRFQTGDVIFREGDPANRFYLLIKGKVQLETERDEKRVPVQIIGAGDVLGWSWLFPPYYTHFDARAVEPTEAMFFYGTRLREMCEEEHEFGYEILKRIAAVVIQRLVASQKELALRTRP
jgi:CRP/FNR family transcriptional regulator, cyclic AMP receptor protein